MSQPQRFARPGIQGKFQSAFRANTLHLGQVRSAKGLGIDRLMFFAKLLWKMTTKTRNWLLAGFIVAFPFTLFFLFLLFLSEGPRPTPPPATTARA